VPGAFVLADVHPDAARDREPPYLPRPRRIQRIEQANGVVAEVRDRILGRDRAGQMHDVADRIPIAELEEGGPVGDVELFDGDLPVEERRGIGTPVRRDDDLLPQIEEGACGVGADHSESAGDEDHARDATSGTASAA
jgi:hypothetical protein